MAWMFSNRKAGPLAWLLFAVVLAPPLHARQDAATQPAQEAAQARPEATAPALPEQRHDEARLRSVPAQAATDALAGQQDAEREGEPQSQEARPSPEPAVSDMAPVAQPAQAMASEPVEPGDAGDAAEAKPVVAPAAVELAAGMRVRGVLFRVTPPALGPLPAELAQEAQPAAGQGATAAAVPVTVVAPAPPRPSYLLGTIHFGTPEEQGIDYAVLAEIAAETETFVNEADLDEAWKPEYDQYRWLPEDRPLSAMLGEEDIAMARALLPVIDPGTLERMKPWSALALLEARGESGGDATMDARLQRMAAAAGKRMVHLETLEQQLQALDCVPADEQARVLGERLRKSWILRIESAEAMAFYRGRNLEAWLASIDRMEGLGDEARAIEQRARRCLLEDRNARWIGQLETVFQDSPALVAVGAVHLVGPDGLIAALLRDGYRVEALPL